MTMFDPAYFLTGIPVQASRPGTPAGGFPQLPGASTAIPVSTGGKGKGKAASSTSKVRVSKVPTTTTLAPVQQVPLNGGLFGTYLPPDPVPDFNVPGFGVPTGFTVAPRDMPGVLSDSNSVVDMADVNATNTALSTLLGSTTTSGIPSTGATQLQDLWQAFTGAIGGVADKVLPDWVSSPIDALKRSGAFDSTDPATKAVKSGWLGPVTAFTKGLGELYLGKKTYDLAKDQANFQKQAYLTNYANQVQSMNRDLEDRQRVRAAGSTKAESVDSYMSRNRVI
jgi:hypothetical protein